MRSVNVGIILLFLFSLIIMLWDPFQLDPMGEGSSSVVKSAYLIPSFVLWVIVYVTRTVPMRLSENDKMEVWKEKIKSFIRLAIQTIGIVITLGAAFNLDLPFLPILEQAFRFLGDNLNTAWEAIGVIIGIATTIYGFFRDKERFEARAMSHGGKRYYPK